MKKLNSKTIKTPLPDMHQFLYRHILKNEIDCELISAMKDEIIGGATTTDEIVQSYKDFSEMDLSISLGRLRVLSDALMEEYYEFQKSRAQRNAS